MQSSFSTPQPWLYGISLAIIPILISYLFKVIENRSSLIKKRSLLEESQKRVDFMKSYFDLQHQLVEDPARAGLKESLSQELLGLKQFVDHAIASTVSAHKKRIYDFKRIFLTFRPIGFWGWTFTIAFYFMLMLLAMLFLASLIPDTAAHGANGTKTQALGDETVSDGTLFWVALAILLPICLLFRYGALTYSDKGRAKMHAADAMH